MQFFTYFFSDPVSDPDQKRLFRFQIGSGRFFIKILFCRHYLKGQLHKIFCFWFFSWFSFPPGPGVFG